MRLRKKIERKLYAERRYITYKKQRKYIRAFYNWLKMKYYKGRINKWKII